MAQARAVNVGSGRRGYWRYLYGSHFWIPVTESEFGRGVQQDEARVSIPPGGLYNCSDLLLHQPGVAQKRGGTSYSGPVMASAVLAPYRSDMLAYSPGLYLELDEVAHAVTAVDSSGNANNATVNGTVTFGGAGLVPGGSGTSAYFDRAAGTYLAVPDAASMNPTTALTIAMWLTLPGAASGAGTAQYTIFQKGSLVVYIEVTTTIIGGLPRMTIRNIIYSCKDSGGHTMTFTAAASSESPTNLIITDDGTTIKMYTDGVLLNSTARSAVGGVTTGFSGVSGNILYIGQTSTATNRWIGTLDEFAIIKNTALTAPNVATLWTDRLTAGAATYARGVAYAEFPAGSQLVGVGDNNGIYTVTSGTTTGIGGAVVAGGIIDRPKLRIGGTQHLLVFPCADGSTGPIVWDGSGTPVACGGSPPGMKVIEIHKGRVVGAGNSANPQRLNFSPAVDITSTWDTSESWIDASHPVTGLASLSNVLLIFSAGHLERLTGTTPPPGTDMDLQPVADVGCTDARSIIVQAGSCIFANQRGVWLTNGAAPVCLTSQGGMQNYWRSLLSTYDPATWVISAGITQSNLLIVTVIDAGGTSTTLMCNVPARAWWPLTNFNANMYAAGVGKQDELYYADSKLPRIVQLSGIFNPSAANKLDANGLAVAPTLETRAIGDGPSLKAFGDGHLTYDMRDAASDAPTMAVRFAVGTEATTYRDAPESPFATTTDATRTRFSTGVDSQAMSIRLEQSGPSSKTEIYALEITNREYPLAAEGQ